MEQVPGPRNMRPKQKNGTNCSLLFALCAKDASNVGIAIFWNVKGCVQCAQECKNKSAAQLRLLMCQRFSRLLRFFFPGEFWLEAGAWCLPVGFGFGDNGDIWGYVGNNGKENGNYI